MGISCFTFFSTLFVILRWWVRMKGSLCAMMHFYSHKLNSAFSQIPGPHDLKSEALTTQTPGHSFLLIPSIWHYSLLLIKIYLSILNGLKQGTGGCFLLLLIPSNIQDICKLKNKKKTCNEKRDLMPYMNREGPNLLHIQTVRSGPSLSIHLYQISGFSKWARRMQIKVHHSTGWSASTLPPYSITTLFPPVSKNIFKTYDAKNALVTSFHLSDKHSTENYSEHMFTSYRLRKAVCVCIWCNS